ncbi:HPr family phosphocarrier protein [Paenibacillus sp. 7124]|uniref:HPr family phosphocarrier protein n=1 Tax=Paenibacillus apii TaxID=1850370 RepID=A0A6M1PJG1_9BACL|nr:HPr family phosphocarrier protein [Paenibacillus apii]NGM83340.1 HPr family phosphocarrier protein [Paenibacillus apii]NJJ38989.1 HPr family phosphocarrier protein [Paenibacillus apii]
MSTNSNNAAIVEIAQTASKFASSIVLQADNKYIDVKSILGLFTTLVASQDYELHVHGADAEDAKKAMSEVFAKHGLKFTVVEE